MQKINVLIVEDHALTRFALVTSLKEQKFINNIYEAVDAQSAYEIVKKSKVDIVLMDLGLSRINGIEATREIKQFDKNIKVIVITSHSEENEVNQCLEAGISAYCSKDIKPDKLIEVIQDVINGSLWFDSNISHFVLNATKIKKIDNSNSKKYNLTAKELQVLNLLKKGETNANIAKELKISVNTIKVHVCSILQKLEVDDRLQAALKAIKENITN